MLLLSAIFAHLCVAVTSAYWITDKETGKQYFEMSQPYDLKHDKLQKACHDIGGMLPEPRNARESQFLYEKSSGVIALGIKRVKGNDWVYESDQSTVTWKNWMSGEPNNRYGIENCVMMIRFLLSYKRNHHPTKWADIPCESDRWINKQKLNLLCERVPGGYVKNVKTCQYNMLDIKCESGSKIQIVRAIYGKSDSRVCPNSPASPWCPTHDVTGNIQYSCDEEPYCQITNFHLLFPDWCTGYGKYIDVTYKCKAP